MLDLGGHSSKISEICVPRWASTWIDPRLFCPVSCDAPCEMQDANGMRPRDAKMRRGVNYPAALLLCFTVTQIQTKIRDPYKLECVARKIRCHAKAICQRDELTSDFYCRCLPGYKGDGVNFCRDPGFHVVTSNLSACHGFGEQVCLLMVTEQKVTFRVAVSASGHHRSYIVWWYKFYMGQSPQFKSYRRRLAPVERPARRMTVASHGRALTLLSISEDDFYPNLFWAEVKRHAPPTKTATIEAYDWMAFEMLNPSKLRYLFVLDSTPADLGKFLEGDTVSVDLPKYLQLPPSSFVRWIKEPQSMTLLESQAEVLANGAERMELQGLRDSDFGYIRALVFDFSPDVPGRVLVAQRLFLIEKDVSKTCYGGRDEKNCRCQSGFEGNGMHCVDINECEKGTPRNCLPEAECANTYGSYFCHCPKGLEGDGLFSCIDIDECTRGTHGCNQDSTCLNTLGSYFCMCQSGFIGDGVHCQAKSTWSPWSPWSICSATCGLQNQMRIRRCTHPESGMRCKGRSAELRLCPHLQPCPVSGQWSAWSPWSICSETCSGMRRRVRRCDSPAPSRGGRPCQGEKDQLAMCDNRLCPVDGRWSSWAPWTQCPVSCGLGVVSRSRHCNSPPPKRGGKNCSGHGYEEGSCGFPEAFCKYLPTPS